MNRKYNFLNLQKTKVVTEDSNYFRSDILRVLQIICQFSAIISFFIGCIALTGWVTKNEILKSITLSLPSMKANSSIAIVFAGLSLWLTQWIHRNRFFKYVQRTSAIIVFVIGLLTLSQYVTGVNIGLDELFFKEPPGAIGTASPNRMAPNSAILFLLCGLALLLIDKKIHSIWISHICILLASIIFLPTIIGYAYGIDFIYGVATTTKMAVHTAVAFLFLIIGILVARPLHGFMSVLTREDAGGYLARKLTLTGIIIPLVFGGIILQGYKLNLFDANFRFLLLIGSCVMVFTFLIWRNALALSSIDRQRKKAEENALFLSEATNILNASLDYKDTLKKIADISVPKLADFCFFDIVQVDGSLNRVAWKHKNTQKKLLLKKFAPFAAASLKTNGPLQKISQTKKPIIFSQNIDDFEIPRGLQVNELLVVPLIIRNELLGILTFCLTKRSARKYTKQDVHFAHELASRAAIAIKNAKLYSDAKKAIRLRDDFISVASHELKTPVTSLKIYTQSLELRLKALQNQQSLKYISKMDNQINRLTTLISDLLDVSRLQLGKLEFRMEAFDLHEIVNDTIEILQPTTKKHLISADGSVKKLVWGDKDRIQQVLTNLISNAIKYSPDADKILVKLNANNNNAAVSVQDFGLGIDKEQQQKIFERFYRVSESKEQTFPGLGIGLFISQEIIKRHGSKITITSERGKGSMFSFILPYTSTK